MKTESIKYSKNILTHTVIEYTVQYTKITLILMKLKLTVIVAVQAAKHEFKAFLV